MTRPFRDRSRGAWLPLLVLVPLAATGLLSAFLAAGAAAAPASETDWAAAFAKARADNPVFAVESVEEFQKIFLYYQDVLDHLLRLIDQIDTQRELMGNVVDASLAIGANRMNEVMKKMTSWGAILIVATLIAGIYGMNFKEMPELGWRYGYAGALGLMLLTTVSLYVYFKRKDWL